MSNAIAQQSAQPLIDVRCVVCGSDAQEVICPEEEVRAHLEYLRLFHRRRLRPKSNGAISSSALTDRADFTQDYTTDVVACRGCGLVFRNPRPPATVITETYAQDHYGASRLEALFEAQVELYRPKAQMLRRWLPVGPETRVIEVGSFVGGFLAAGQEHGWDMFGIDPGEAVDAFCRGQGLRVFRGTLSEAPLETNSIDCVAIWNTFDQLPYPEPTITAARRALRPGGILAVRVPNGACFRFATAWTHRLPRPLRGWLRAALAWNNLLAFPYLYGYSVRTLDRLLSQFGLERVSIEPDTLTRLADAQTKTWAAWEERLLKLFFRLAVRVDMLRPASTLACAPWLDAYYRLPH